MTRSNVLDGGEVLPLAVLRRSALDTNRARLRHVAKISGVSWSPHAKTFMSPQLVAEQLEDGVWGVTAATVAQTQRLRDWGVNRILIANQVVDQANLRNLGKILADPAAEIYVVVDSIEACDRLIEVVPPGLFCRVLVEVGLDGGRTGTRSDGLAIAIARHLASASALKLCGVEAFEYVFEGSAQHIDAKVESILDLMVDVALELDSGRLFQGDEILLTAGGSMYYDRVIDRLNNLTLSKSVRVVVRAGCAIVHDHGVVARGYERLACRAPQLVEDGIVPDPALEIWAVIQSRPTSTLALLAVGKRDLSFDIDMPRPVRWARDGKVEVLPPGIAVTRLNDHHAFLELPEKSALKVGDLVGLGISHPCTTFDRWRRLLIVDESYAKVGEVRTYFREED